MKKGKFILNHKVLCDGWYRVEDGFAHKALDSVKDKLDSDHGIVLHQPAYTVYNPTLGEISSYPPGYKENAGIFCHNNPWIACAETMIGRGQRAFDIYKRIAPAYREDISHHHKLEPYVYAQMITGKDAKRFGQAKKFVAYWNSCMELYYHYTMDFRH